MKKTPSKSPKIAEFGVSVEKMSFSEEKFYSPEELCPPKSAYPVAKKVKKKISCAKNLLTGSSSLS